MLKFISILGWALFLILATPDFAKAAMRSVSRGEFSSGGGSSSSGSKMLVDLSAHYVRDTKPDGAKDTAGRLSIGGMFNSWVGLDLQGMYQVKSKNYLVGTDLRLAPTEWFFLKGGIGAYADKLTGEFKTTPLAGAGILATLTQEIYAVSEFSYFQFNRRNNVSFGVGVGAMF